jgi:D-xylose transport system substrate-binding protein
MKKIRAVAIGAFLLSCLAYSQAKIGLSFSDFATQRWPRECDEMSSILEAGGFEIIVREANHDARLQAAQLREMAKQGASVIIVVAEDGKYLAPVVDEVTAKGTKVIAFDRLIPSPTISAYVSFDNFEIGRLQAGGIIEALKPDTKGRIVLLCGSPTDVNAHIFRAGQMDVLQPLFNSGKLKIVADRWVDNWVPLGAKNIMKEIIASTNGEFDGIVASNDGLALGAIEAMRDCDALGPTPVSGQDATEAGCNYIARGELALTILKDTRLMAPEACSLAIRLSKGVKDLGLPKIALGNYYHIEEIQGEYACDFIKLHLITKANLKGLIVDLGWQSYEGVYEGVENPPPR